jgi:hypothetical protein
MVYGLMNKVQSMFLLLLGNHAYGHQVIKVVKTCPIRKLATNGC